MAGQLGKDPETGEVAGTIEAQTRRALGNVRAVLEAAGSGLDRVVKTTVYLANMSDFPAVNEVYATYFRPPAPARATIQAAGLPKGVLVEIDLIAVLD